MPGRGPAPKPNAHRRVSGKAPEKVPTTVIDAEPQDELVGPELPADFDWPEATRRWWDTWRRSEQVRTFTSTDWDFLLDTARLHKALWTMDDDKLATKHGVAAELRLRVAKYGATPEDRLRLRMTMGRKEVAEPAAKPEPAAADRVPGERRARLLKAVEGERAG